MHAYYEALAQASAVPVLVYYFPEFSSSIRTLDQVTSLCSIPNVVGLKFTDYDLHRLSQIANSGNIIFSGRDEVFVAGMLMGADGGIGSFYNHVPELFGSIYEDALKGFWTTARETQHQVNALIQAVLQFPMLPALKRLLTWSGIDCGYPVLPRRTLTREEESALRIAVENAGFAPDRFLR